MATKEGWGFPQLSKKTHYFLNGRSLCMKWMYLGTLETGNNTSPDNCKQCMKLRLKREIDGMM
ncbi:MAG: hypothetical protein WAW23_05600 [Candidatus Methanoperedens sp.]